MAHNIAKTPTGGASFYGAREKAWHGLGQITETAQTSAEAIKLAGLDYKVGIQPIYLPIHEISIPDAKTQENVLKDGDKYFKANKIPNKYGTYRMDTGQPFGVVGSKYKIIQNVEAFDFFDNIIGAKEAIFETAGALGNGESIFITAKLPNTILVNGKDPIDQYLLLSTTHDGTSATFITFTPIRVVCENTLTMALQGSKFKVSIRHSKSASEKLKQVETILGITKKAAIILEEDLTAFTEFKMKDEEVMNFLMQSLDLEVDEEGKLSTKSSNVLKKTMDYYVSGVGQDTIECRGTLYGAYNAVTGYFQNVKDYKTNEDKFTDINNGTGTIKMNRAFSIGRNLILK